MTLGSTPDSSPGSTPPWARGIKILATAAILAVLYLGREVLVPITLAILLSLLIAPLVAVFKRWRFGQVSAVLCAVGIVSLVLAGIGLAIVLQLASMGQQLPQYERTLAAKVQVIQAFAVEHLQALEGESENIFGQTPDEPEAAASSAGDQARALRQAGNSVVPVEVREPRPTAFALMMRLASSIWAPVGTAAVVLITLVFALLEHESLRDRLIRLIGGQDLRTTTYALNDAGERLSRYFLSQLGINVCVGTVIGLALMVVGLPQSLLWGTLTALLRFVPYVGIFIAAGCVALFSAAVDTGWTLCIAAVAVFVAVELVVSQAVEPLLYGHSTGLSPISVVIAAIFWSWIWGPIGLLLSTPMTLCLVVAGRNVKGLEFLDILFGDTPALTLSQRFYQRSLVGDAHALIADARRYLARSTLARYCDEVMMPAFKMASADFAAGSISPRQEKHVRRSIVSFLSVIGPETQRSRQKGHAQSAIDLAWPGIELRRQREAALGKWQGSLDVLPGTIVICVGAGLAQDALGVEILVRVLRDAGVDARHVSLVDFDSRPDGAKAESFASVVLVGLVSDESVDRVQAVATTLRRAELPVPLIGFFPITDSGVIAKIEAEGGVEVVLVSFEEAVKFLMARPGAAAV